MSKKYTHCAECGEELGDQFYTYRDNFLQVKYFEQQDGSDNAFCSSYCAVQSLMLEEIDNEVEVADAKQDLKQEDAKLREKRSRAIVLPCCIGDKMYIIKKGIIKQERVNEINMGNTVFRFRLEYTQYHTKDDIGKTVFFSKEEAEKMLQARGNELLVTK